MATMTTKSSLLVLIMATTLAQALITTPVTSLTMTIPNRNIHQVNLARTRAGRECILARGRA
jgi:hypothetical protein